MLSITTFEQWTLVLSALGIALLAGKALRARFKIFGRFMIPSALIAGFLMVGLGPEVLGIIPQAYYPRRAFSELAKVLLSVVFAGMFIGVSFNDDENEDVVREAGTQIILGETLAWGQLALGLIVAGAMTWFLGLNLHPAFGLSLPIGFDGGAGVAPGYKDTFMKMGWMEGMYYGIASGVWGLFAASIVGMAVVNWGARNDHTKVVENPEDLPESMKTGLLQPKDFEPAATRTVATESLDPLAFHGGLIALAIAVGYGFRWWLQQQPGVVGEISSYMPLFPLAMIAGLVFNVLMNRTGVGHLVDRDSVERIQGTALDFAILSGVASISVAAIAAAALPLVVILTLGTIWNLVVFLWMSPRIFENFWFERGVMQLGQASGNVPCGLMLLRVVDPDFETPALSSFSINHAIHSPIFFTFLAITPILAVKYGVLPLIGVSIAWIAMWWAIGWYKGWWHAPEETLRNTELTMRERQVLKETEAS